MIRQRLTGPMVTRAAAAAGVEILDEESRVVRVSFSSETPYKRTSWFDEPWIEVLGHKADEVDLTRLMSKAAPALYGHNPYARAMHVGIVENGWLQDGRGYADIRLSKRDDVADLWRDIRDGIVRNISVGYNILERVLTKKSDKVPSEYRVTRWIPMEISFVAIPADATVGVGRSDDAVTTRFIVTDLPQEETEMERTADDTPAQAQPTPGGSPAAAVDQTVIREEATRAERTRVAEINKLVTRARAPASIAEAAIRDGHTLDAVREAVINHFADQDVHHPARMEAGADSADKFRTGVQAWLLNRSGYRDEKGQPVSVDGNEFRGLTLIELARQSLQLAGVRVVGMSRMELALRAITHSTSDFPVILQNVLHKTLLTAYAITPDTWSRFCAKGTLADFRPHYRYRMGSFSDLAAVTENNEFVDGTISDAERESITAATKGRILNISRQMIVNDDVGAFTNLAGLMGRAAKRTVEKDVYALLALNSDFGPTMSDGITLFHASHNNVSTGTVTVANIDAARAVMAVQTNPGGAEIIDLRPAIWLGPVGLEGSARVVNESQWDPDANNKLQRPNIARGILTDIVGTGRRTGTPWFLFADPAQEPVIEVGFLDGVQEPFLDMQEGFRVDGVSWKVRLDYAVAAVGWRGAVRSTGA